MLTTNCEKYLGQIISSTGKLENNINDRFNKGLGIVNEILGMLKEVSFGYHYFQIAMLFRNSKLVNGILYSIETLYGLTNAHIDKLEQCDRLLMRKCSIVFQARQQKHFISTQMSYPSDI